MSKKRKFAPMSDDVKRQQLTSMLAPLTQQQLKELLITAAVESDAIFAKVQATANADPASRKLFVRGLAWEITTPELEQIMSVHGEVEEAAVIMDRATGKSKGFGFVTYKDIQGANAALANPEKQIAGRTVHCNLAALGPQKSAAPAAPAAMGGGGYNAGAVHTGAGPAPVALRKLFVRGLSWDTNNETLLREFGQYGQIEEGAICMDRATGKSRGFAFVTFATAEGANAALAQEAKMIDGRTTHCNLAEKGKYRNQTQQQAPPPQQYGQMPGYGAAPQYNQYAQQGGAAYGQPQQQQAFAGYGQQAPQAAYGQQAPQAAYGQQAPQMGMYGAPRQ